MRAVACVLTLVILAACDQSSEAESEAQQSSAAQPWTGAALDGTVVLHSFKADGTWRGAARVPLGAAILADRRGRIGILDDRAVNGAAIAARTPFPDFALPTLGSEADTIWLESLRGRVVILNVWASWCAPCREELPALERLAEEMPHVTVLGLNDDSDPAVGLRFARALGLGLRSAAGRGRLVEAFGLRGLPHTVVLDRELRVVGRIDGFGGTLDSVRELVNAASGATISDEMGVRSP